MDRRWVCGLWKDKSCRPTSLNILFSFSQHFQPWPKIKRPTPSAPPHKSSPLSPFYLSLALPSFSAVTSSGQLRSIALWRTKPFFVYMATERQAGRGVERGERREGWAGEKDNQAHTCTHHIGSAWFQRGVVLETGACDRNWKKENWLLITCCTPMCKWVSVCV